MVSSVIVLAGSCKKIKGRLLPLILIQLDTYNSSIFPAIDGIQIIAQLQINQC